MKTSTSKRTILLRSFTLLPLLALLIYGFSSTQEKVKEIAYDTTEVADYKATPKQIEEYNKLAKKYNDMPKDNMVIKGKELTRMRYLYDLMTIEQRKNAEPYPNIPPPPLAPDVPPAVKVIKGVNDGDANIPPPPPPPPAPEDPMDHVIKMAKKGATFYYEGDKISSDKAIRLLKKNKNLNIQTTRHNSKNPVVKISKNPKRKTPN